MKQHNSMSNWPIKEENHLSRKLNMHSSKMWSCVNMPLQGINFHAGIQAVF